MEAGKHGRTPGAQNDLICALLADGVEETIGARNGGLVCSRLTGLHYDW
jgi:hypothetical protein